VSGLVSAVGLWPALGVVLPLIVGLLTKQKTKSGWQGLFLVSLSVAFGLVEAYVKAHNSGAAFNWHAAIVSAFSAGVVGQFLHSSVWKTTGISARLQAFSLWARNEAETAAAEVPESVQVKILTEVQKFTEAALAKLETNSQLVTQSADSNARVVAQAAAVVAEQASHTPQADRTVESVVAPTSAAAVVPADLVVPGDEELTVPAS
jgi:hypothetical protein